MKKRQLTYCLLFALLLACLGLRAQNLFTGAAGERIQVCTDRTMYVSGEKVFFSAVVYHLNENVKTEFSRIFYCELITPDGKKIAGRKFLLQNSTGQGCVTIPQETVSGIYFLKCYTRFMRNAGTHQYKYVMLKIINPFKSEVLTGNYAHDTTVQEGNSMKLPGTDESMTIISGKNTFAPREKVRLSIIGNTGKEPPAALSLSVIPESTYNDVATMADRNPNGSGTGLFLPETRGISLSGQVIGKESGKPVPNARVNLSVIGDKDILVVLTDSNGRFIFALAPFHGNRDIFLCSEATGSVTPEILIDNDFCSKQVYLHSPRFALDAEESKAALKLAVNSKITAIFNKDTLSHDYPGEENKTPFYGKPTEVLEMENYIDMPTLDEYFSELPVMVKLKKVRGKKHFWFLNAQADMALYDPLVLVDWVAVNDIEKVLAMPPQTIERIELVNTLYIKGNITFGGIISFVSKKNDFAGIDLPASGKFINYNFLDTCSGNVPSPPLHRNIPDSRNTVYWNPAVQTNTQGVAGISFTVPDTPGRYYILLRATSKSGEVTLTKETFFVKRD